MLLEFAHVRFRLSFEHLLHFYNKKCINKMRQLKFQVLSISFRFLKALFECLQETKEIMKDEGRQHIVSLFDVLSTSKLLSSSFSSALYSMTTYIMYSKTLEFPQ